MSRLMRFFLPLFAGEHAIYLSVIEVEVEEKTSIRVKVFTDDMQNTIRNFSSSFRYRSDKTFGEDNLESINRYFQKYLAFKIDGSRKKQQLKTIDRVGDSYRIYFELEENEWSRLEVRATYFMELFPTQQQVMSVEKGGQKKLFGLDQKAPSCVVNF